MNIPYQKLLSSAASVAIGFLIVLAIMYFHWQSSNPTDITSLYDLAVSYFFYCFGLSVLITISISTSGFVSSGVKGQVSDAGWLQGKCASFSVLAWLVTGCVFFVSYIPYL